jgi:hypothetical protein
LVYLVDEPCGVVRKEGVVDAGDLQVVLDLDPGLLLSQPLQVIAHRDPLGDGGEDLQAEATAEFALADQAKGYRRV